MNPTDAVIAVTMRCNCRCTMCNIWRMATTSGADSEPHELWPEAYRRLPASLRDINITRLWTRVSSLLKM
jgi:MoaA/NifB/PqqE/SkfB family radical SAM enzyme